jgi:hypothetical protein
MRTIPIILTLVLSLSVASAQLDSNSITVTASRGGSSGTPDQAIFGVAVTSGLDTSLDDVVALLQGSGISAANLQALDEYPVSTGVSGQPTDTLNWRFSFTAPLAKNKDTIAMLTSLQQTIAKKNSGATMSFSIQGTQSSVQPQTCSQSDLLTDARTQAQKLADGAGVSVGNILAVSSPTTATLINPLLGASPAPCILTVKFALLRY